MISPDLRDLVQRDLQAAQEAAVRNEEAHKANVKLFAEMFLSLGADCIKVAGSSRHDAELAEARGLAAYRWEQLLGMEQQIQREATALESRPKKRPAQSGDELVPDRTIAEWEEAFEHQTKHAHVALAALREQAKRERRELEGFTRR